MKRQGADRHALAVRKDDFYATPACCTRALIREAQLPDRCWEPAAGKGDISRELRAAGIHVTASDLRAYRGRDPDIQTGLNFLRFEEAPYGLRCVVTNPPYRIADAFVRHALQLVDDVWVFVRFMSLEGIGRSDIIDGHLRTVLLGRERPPMLHRHGWAGPRLKGSGAPFCWALFTRKPTRGRPIALRRISWREP